MSDDPLLGSAEDIGPISAWPFCLFVDASSRADGIARLALDDNDVMSLELPTFVDELFLLTSGGGVDTVRLTKFGRGTTGSSRLSVPLELVERNEGQYGSASIGCIGENAPLSRLPTLFMVPSTSLVRPPM
jgi:hypothetical protein